MMGTVPDVVVSQVRKLWTRLERNPNWMENPRAWHWRGASGPQGLSLLASTHPGLANLLWLSMDLDAPPQNYDANQNHLWTWIVMQGAAARMEPGKPLLMFDAAQFLSLREFHDALPMKAPVSRNPVERAAPLFKLLASRRLRHAKP